MGMKEHRQLRKFWSFLLAFAMVFTTAVGNIGPVVMAADDDTFVEVTVPNGDFESGETAWTFTGDIQNLDYYWKLFQSAAMTNNQTTMYEVCSKKNTSVTKTYKCSQTVKGLVPGTYKASIDATGGNDPGTHTTTLTAGGKSVAVTPNKWNEWVTYTTDMFEVGEDGTCEISIDSTVTGQYLDMDNVKLYRKSEAGPKTVDKVADITKKVIVGSTFTAPTQATVLYTDGTNALFDVTWNSDELAKVDTKTAGRRFTVNGKVTVEGTAYDAVMNVEVLDASGLVQEVPEGSLGSVDFDANWQFYLATRTPKVADGGFAAAGVKDAGDYTTDEIVDPSFNDLGWRTVDVPHDFSIEGEKVKSSSDAQAYLEGGLGYYRKRFTVPASMESSTTNPGRRITIDFEGVYQNSVVYLNGEKIGSYPSGYTGFALDITKKVKYGEENVLVVKVQNMSPSGRWYTGSGIIRPVHLVIDNQAHFNRNGITLTTPTLEDDYTASKTGALNIEATGYSDSTNSNVYMEVTVLDADGKEVAKKSTEKTAINPTTAFTLSLKDRDAVEVSNVNLWYPWNLGTPYLYKVKVDLYQEINGSSDGYQLIDTEETEYGFRWVKVKETTSDPTSGGLYVNGQYTKVQGVDLHHDSGALGAASYSDAYDREFDKLMAMGVNAYRTSHCPPSKQAIEVCRRKGILVVEEAFDGWGAAKATYDFGNFFFQEVPSDWAGLKPNGYTQLPTPGVNYDGAKLTWSDWVVQEMVNRDKNEPSVIAWSIGNEVRGVGSKPFWYDVSKYDLLGVNPDSMNEYTEAVRLMGNVNAADGTRYVLMGGDQERSVPAANKVWGYVNQVLDGYGLNYNTGKSVDGLISRYAIGDGTLLEKATKTFFFESESSSQTSSRGVYLDPQFTNTGINQTPGKRGGSNYDNDFAAWTMSNEYGLKKDRDRKSFIGQFIWTGFDYLGEPTPYSVYPVGVSSFGTIDTAGFAKDSFYLYQSQWTSTPMVHLLPTNWDQWHDGEEVEVWVNTNQPSAELFLNGESLGKKSFDEKETAYGKKYYETSEKTQDDKTWGDSTNPGGYTSNGAVLDDGELNSGKLHLTWKVPYQAGTLEVKAYDKNGKVVATDSVSTSSTPYTISAVADKTVLKADGTSLSYVECTVVDENGNMVPDADNLVKFAVSGKASIVGVDNGKQESAELYKYDNVDKSSYSERMAYNGKVLVILKSEKEAGDALLTISSDNLKPVQVALKVTENGTGDAPKAAEVTGTEKSVDAVNVTVPTGMSVTLPSVVKVNYTGSAGDYSLLKKVTWSEVKDGKAEGTIEGSKLTAQAAITESDDAATDVELAAGKASATASFTGSDKNYPQNMLDGNDSTSWTNAYSRGASVLLPANSASRKNEYVEFDWEEAQVLNQITLNFKESRYCAIPKVLEAQYWDGADWASVSAQSTVKESGAPAVMQFKPVYTTKVRVYMENATPYTTSGNMEITEASVKLSTEKLGARLVLEGEDAVVQGKNLTMNAKLANLSSDNLLGEVSFHVSYDADVFEAPTVALKDGIEGTLTSTEADGKILYTLKNEAGIPASTSDFAVITMKAKADAQPGSYSVGLENVTAKDTTGASADLTSTAITVKVNERPITGEVTYLSDIDWKYAQSGWESVMKNQYCNGAASGAISLSVDGEQTYFSKGLGANADATVEYDVSSYKAQLEENEKLYFQAYVGIDYFKTAKKQNGDGVYFVIYDGEVDADGNIQGTEIYRSAKLDSYSDAEHISIDISGIQKNLVLFMDKVENNAHDNGDWADAKLIHVPDPNAADKVELKQTLDIAKALKEADYTVESYKALQKALADAQAVYADKKATQEAVNAQAAALQAAVQGLKVPDAADYQEVLKKLQNKENELTQKDEELKTANAKVTELQSELKTAQDDLKKLQDSVDAKESEIAAKEAEITKLNGELASAKEEVSTLKKEKTDLEKSVNDYRARILELEAAAKKQKEESDAAYKKLQEEKEAAEAALKQAQAEIERLKAQQNQEQPKPEETLKVGDTVTSGNVKYRVINAQKKLAEAYGVDSRKARTLKVAAAVTISGEKVSVTSIAANAFKGMKKLEKVTIGTNVSKIGKNAFSGDSKLKSIQIKSKKLTSVGKGALKNISAKAVIKVPKSKKKAYRSLLKGKGQKKSVKIK